MSDYELGTPDWLHGPALDTAQKALYDFGLTDADCGGKDIRDAAVAAVTAYLRYMQEHLGPHAALTVLTHGTE